MAASIKCCSNTAPQLLQPYCCYVLCLGGDEHDGGFLADWRHAWGEEGCAIPLRCTLDPLVCVRLRQGDYGP